MKRAAHVSCSLHVNELDAPDAVVGTWPQVPRNKVGGGCLATQERGQQHLDGLSVLILPAGIAR